MITQWGFIDCISFVGEEKGTEYFIAVHADFILLSFRGTQEKVDFGVDARATMKEELGGEVHSGFQMALDEVWPENSSPWA